MEQSLRSNAGQFESLVAELQADSQMTSLDPNILVFGGLRVDLRESGMSAIERAGMSKERWMHYQHEVQQLGLYGVMKTGGDTVELKVDTGSFSNGVSYKSYVYIVWPPPHIRASLDAYRISDEDKVFFGWEAYKHIEGYWYLHIVVLR
jgi:hypothetical protein